MQCLRGCIKRGAMKGCIKGVQRGEWGPLKGCTGDVMGVQ